ncbi:membrane protein [Croceivirga lutea]|uniref:YitT family protein n=1 Tax=Croceivirga lutea TaxID=1775167 RepID=UPI00163B5921|nr:YitT family protein [Croceivirga lutea]GGG45066.1 membrane protein [Croceivirga lutea]
MSRNIVKETLSEGLQIGFAVILASIGLKAFLLPNGFLDGGVTGIAILLSELFHIDISLVLPLASIPFFIIGYFTITKRILFKSVISIILLALVIHFENFSSITDDKLIIATFGGLFLGCGIGMAIRGGSVLDGSEILGLYLNERYGFSIGSIILFFNIILFGITALILTPEIAMYSILTYLVTSKAIDFTIQGFENYVGLMIVSKKSEAIQAAFLDKIGQGITIYQGVKGHGKSGASEVTEIIHIVVTRIDTRRIHRLIETIDKDAFITEFDVNHIKGGKIRRFLAKTK